MAVQRTDPLNRASTDPDCDDTDDPQFVDAVSRIIRGILHVARPPDVFVVKLDTWFGSRWLRFSHKAFGALGIAFTDLRVPPFVPPRVRSEKYFVRDAATNQYEEANPPLVLHVTQTSSANARRKISRICPTAALFWWSGATQRTGRGALMAYIPSDEGHAAWYAELTQSTGWRSGAMKNISARQLDQYRTLADAS